MKHFRMADSGMYLTIESARVNFRQKGEKKDFGKKAEQIIGAACLQLFKKVSLTFLYKNL